MGRVAFPLNEEAVLGSVIQTLVLSTSYENILCYNSNPETFKSFLSTLAGYKPKEVKSGKSRRPRYLPEELGCSFLEERVLSSVEKVQIFCGNIGSILYNTRI